LSRQAQHCDLLSRHGFLRLQNAQARAGQAVGDGKIEKHGKGIVLVHDFQRGTAEAAMDLLNDLKAGGYKIVFMQPKYSVSTIASYDEAVLKQAKGSVTDTRPTSSVVRTISE